MTTRTTRDIGDTSVRATIRPCSLGHVLVAATRRGVCAVAFSDDPGGLERTLRDRFPGATVGPSDDRLDRLATLMVDLTNGAPIATDIPLDLVGTTFQRRVWSALSTIPPGTTATYAELAKRIGFPRAVRAVGTACGANPVAIAVPCHRVIRADGALGGYRWGLERKKKLLAREQAKRSPASGIKR